MDARIRKVFALLEGNYHREVSFKKLARAVNLSLWHFYRLFKNETGMTPARYLKQLRMERAAHLLQTTFLNVKEIMLKVGVRDESHFVRDFRQAYGTTPTRYRLLHLSNQPRSKEQAKSANK